MGGTLDRETGQMVWTMHVPLVEQLAFYRSHPPHALGSLRATPVEELAWTFDGHGEPVNSIFELACPCGNTRFATTCGVRTVEDETEVAPPIAIECSACDEMFEIFDPGDHGWNAVMCQIPFEEPDSYDELEGRKVKSPHEVLVRFEHGSDTLGDPQLAGREPEVFTWFTVLARDPATKELEQLFECECA